jgi:hypothetical protein
MVEAGARRLFQSDWPTRDWEEISEYWQERREVYRDRTRQTLEAIEPMIGKLIGDAQASEGELMREAGRRAGYAKGYARGCADMEEDYNL